MLKHCLRYIMTPFIVLCLTFSTMTSTHAAPLSVRIKDIVTFEGVRENQLVGYGLVVGLNNSGDTIRQVPYTKESLTGMLERLGVNIRDIDLTGRNVAAVMVTATLPPFARHGSRIDVSVSSLGDARDLRGGTLLVTPLLGADGEVYAVAQGPLAVGGFTATGLSETSVTKGVPTSGKISNGAIVEREVGFELVQLQSLHLSLRNPDFTTARRIADAINKMEKNIAIAIDPSTVHIIIPETYRSKEKMMSFLTRIEQLTVVPDQVARIVVDDQDGVIVMNEQVRVSPVAVTHGSITIKIEETPQISQPSPFSELGRTVRVERSDITIQEESGKFTILDGGVSLSELVNGLNALGATPRDLITILRSIKASGAIQAELEVI